MGKKRSIKLKFNPSSNTIYFLTLCCKERVDYFGTIDNDKMLLNESGKIASDTIKWLTKEFPYIVLHNHVVMPNHIHLLIEIAPLTEQLSKSTLKIKSVSQLIKIFKTTAAKQIHLTGNTDFQWQRSFYNHAVSSEVSYDSVYSNISNNAQKWDEDSLK